ncbi:alcohol acetyltransferase [Xylogone sp. PMI_703]|nr:alcohol acetyltransferase [Xylogone sp. PMI_703]
MTNILRPLGNVEKASAARHSIGYYRSVANTATYSIPVSSLNGAVSLQAVLEAALVKVILRHPALCCGIINEDTQTPAFVRLDEIDVRKHIQYETIQATNEKEYDAAMVNLIARQHSQLWPEPGQVSPWKTIVFEPEKAFNETKKVLDIAFFFHHSIGDGLSGMAFHLSFLPALNSITNDPASISTHSPIITVPNSLTLIDPIEKQMAFPVSYSYLINVLWRLFRPTWLFPDRTLPPWSGEKVTFPDNIDSYKANTRLLTIPAPLVTTILNECRRHNSTITSLLNALTVTSLATIIPSPQPISSSTPYSLRPWTKTPKTEITLQTSEHSSRYELETISSLRSAVSKNDAEDLISQIWTIAASMKSKLTADLATVPADNIIGVLDYITDWHKFCTDQLGKPRKSTFEISNVGVLNPLPSSSSLSSAAEETLWTISRDIFTQCASVTGEALCISVASVDGGPLAISFNWQEGVVEAQLVEDVMGKIEKMLVCIGRGEKISLQ